MNWNHDPKMTEWSIELPLNLAAGVRLNDPVLKRRRSALSFNLVAVAPVFFAACTWNDGDLLLVGGMDLRLIGLPVLALEVAFILLAFCDGWRPLKQLSQSRSIVKLLLSCLIGVAVVSSVVSAPDRTGSMLWTYLSAVHLLFGFTTAWRIANADEATVKSIWPKIVLGCCAYAILVWLYAAKPHPPHFNWEYFGLAVSNIRQVGFYCIVGLMAAIGCASRVRGARALAYAAAGATVLALACWSGSRGALVAYICATVLGWLLMRPLRTLHFVGISALTFVVGGSASLLLSIPEPVFGFRRMVSSVSEAHNTDPSSGRLRMWDGAWHAVLRRPLLGYGEGQFGRVVPQIQGIYLHPHDLILQLLFQWGVIGTAVVGALGFLAIRSLHEKGVTDDPRAMPAVLVVIALLAYSMYDGTLFHAYPTMMFSFALAAALGLAPQELGVDNDPVATP